MDEMTAATIHYWAAQWSAERGGRTINRQALVTLPGCARKRRFPSCLVRAPCFKQSCCISQSLTHNSFSIYSIISTSHEVWLPVNRLWELLACECTANTRSQRIKMDQNVQNDENLQFSCLTECSEGLNKNYFLVWRTHLLNICNDKCNNVPHSWKVMQCVV